MRTLINEKMDKYTTVKIGGIAEKFYIPESVSELAEVTSIIPPDEIRLIGGGSNLLINDQTKYPRVIYLGEFNNSIEHRGKGSFYVGASVALQRLIRYINELGYGGIEYLYSVPALTGGAIVMNAGRGRVHNLSISDYLQEVHILDLRTSETRYLSKENCEFGYRSSVFQKNSKIVIGAVFTFKKTDPDEGIAKREERIRMTKLAQDYSGFNFGSVFCECNGKIMKFIRFTHPGYKNGMMFSNKTSNWLLNKGEGSFVQAVKLINRVIKYHNVIGAKTKLEVVIWE